MRLQRPDFRSSSSQSGAIRFVSGYANELATGASLRFIAKFAGGVAWSYQSAPALT